MPCGRGYTSSPTTLARIQVCDCLRDCTCLHPLTPPLSGYLITYSATPLTAPGAPLVPQASLVPQAPVTTEGLREVMAVAAQVMQQTLAQAHLSGPPLPPPLVPQQTEPAIPQHPVPAATGGTPPAAPAVVPKRGGSSASLERRPTKKPKSSETPKEVVVVDSDGE